MATSSANSTSTARKTKQDKYDFNPEDNLQRRKKLQRLIKQGHLRKQAIRIGSFPYNQQRQEGPCAPNYLKHQQCLIENEFRMSRCFDLQQMITKCERENGLIQESVKNAIQILETRKVNEWKVNEMKAGK